MDPIDQHLIELIEKCLHIYDKSSCDYKDKIKTQNSWCSIAKLLNATVADCEHRWGQLRERFTRERRILKVGLPSGSGSSKQPTPSELYKALQFLEPHIRSRRTRGNILKQSISPVSPLEDSATWDTLEIDDPDVFEYVKSVEDKSKLETLVKNELKESEIYLFFELCNIHSNKLEKLFVVIVFHKLKESMKMTFLLSS